MGSLLHRRLYFVINSVARSNNILSCKRLAQTHAVVTSLSDIQKPSNEVVPVFKYASQFGDRTALRDRHGDYTYSGLYLSSKQFANDLTELLGEANQERVAFLMPNDAAYVIVQWACWMSGQIAVPLSDQYPSAVLDYYIKDSDAKVIITTQEYLPLLEPLITNTDRRLIVFDNVLRVIAMKVDGKLANNRGLYDHQLETSPDAGVKGDFYNKSDAMFIYTSGTTSKPKGVVLTHKNLRFQVNSLIQAWKLTEKDIFLHTLPLNHVHGVINLLLCPLYVGARCVMLPKFETSSVWSQLLAVNQQSSERINVFMAVPTIYMKLIQEYDQLFSKNDKIRGYIRNVCSNKIRLMVSGSAPLPKPVFDRWEKITGHRLLERYGMSETGMVLSNPLEGERIPETVGTPLPGVEVRITKSTSNKESQEVMVYGNASKNEVMVKVDGRISGDLQVKSENIFKKYWNRPKTTAESFTADKWFKTGDTVRYENGIYKILGRSSVDIIKTGGYKVSALEVETVILGHPKIIDCTVIGIPSLTWGQKVAAVVVVAEGTELALSQLREYAKGYLPNYSIPTVLKVIDKIPKNSMGKVNKPNILKTVFPRKKP